MEKKLLSICENLSHRKFTINASPPPPNISDFAFSSVDGNRKFVSAIMKNVEK